jgi:hypothetical protein
VRSTYLIGSLRNAALPLVAAELRKVVEVFDDWYAAGPTADDAWREYEQRRGHSYPEALQGLAAHHVFRFDHHHLQRCESAVLVLPAGKSAHLELGWMLGQGKPGWILVDTPDRWDVMYKFATGVVGSIDDLVKVVGEWAGRAADPVRPPRGDAEQLRDATAWANTIPTMTDAYRLRAHLQGRAGEFLRDHQGEPVYCFTCGMLIGPGSPPERHERCRA